MAQDEDQRDLVIDVEVEEVEAEDYDDGRRGYAHHRHRVQPKRMGWKAAILLRVFFLLLWILLSVYSLGCLMVTTGSTIGWYLTGKTNFNLNALRKLYWLRFWGACLGTLGCLIGVFSPTLGIAFMAMYLFSQDITMPGSSWFIWMRDQMY